MCPGRQGERAALFYSCDVRFWVGITDADWYQYLSTRGADEVNFWQPGERIAARLEPGTPFLFKLHARDGGHIVGGAFFAHFSVLPVRLAWDAFQDKNGAATLEQMASRISRYRPGSIDLDAHRIGCNVLTQPFFFPVEAIVPTPMTWPRSVQQGRTYDTATPEGQELWEQVQAALASTAATADRRLADPSSRYGEPVITRPRLGQGAFRVLVTDAYERRCAVTSERTLPVLEAAHIRPYAQNGAHEIDNGLLLRADLHTLFDRGYVTVTPDMRFHVSPRIREEFQNGRDYYALDGREVRPPGQRFAPPAREYLEWHSEAVFRA